jgi:hypothetical protein
LGFYLLYLGGGTLISAHHDSAAPRAGAASAYISSNRST